MESKTYILTFYNPTFDYFAFNAFMRSSVYVEAYWNYLPLIYCFRSSRPINELRVHFEPYFGYSNFMIAEINPFNVDGRLPDQAAWDWFRKHPTNSNIGRGPFLQGLLDD